MEEQEQKSFNANDCINALEKKISELLQFICEQSVTAYASDCRERAIKEMGYGAYLAWLIDTDNEDELDDKDKDFIINKLKSAV